MTVSIAGVIESLEEQSIRMKHSLLECPFNHYPGVGSIAKRRSSFETKNKKDVDCFTGGGEGYDESKRVVLLTYIG